MSQAVHVTIGPEGYSTAVEVRGHHLRGDEPRDAGGDDTGPTPYELLLAALGTCTAMTIRMYADRKQWPLEGVTVDLDQQRIHARDCRDCESETGPVLRIRKRVRLSGDGLDGEQRKRLHEIGDRCPVHRSLTSEIRIDSEAA